MAKSVADHINELITQNKTFIFSKSYCPYCNKAKTALDSINVKYETIELDKIDNGDAYQDELNKITGFRSVPNVFINGKSIGGGDDTQAKVKSGEVAKLLGL